MAPNYLSELCRPNAEDTARSRLCSAARGDLQVPCSKTNFGSRAFAVAGPMFWNRLPPEIRANDSLQSFKSQLKTLFLTLITSSAGALELDSMLWRLRSQRVIIIIITGEKQPCWQRIGIKRGFQPYATHAMRGFKQRKPFTQHTQCIKRMQEVANDMAGICHVMWFASNQNVPFLLQGMFWTLCCLHKPCVVCIMLV